MQHCSGKEIFLFMKIEFRPAAIPDAVKILEMMQQFYLIDNYSFSKDTTAENIIDFINTPSFGKIWLIENNDGIIGYIILAFIFSFEFKGKNAFVDELYLEDKYRSLGIGTKAIDFVAGEAKKLNITALHLEVEKHNENALKVYRKHGFSDHNRLLMTKHIDKHTLQQTE